VPAENAQPLQGIYKDSFMQDNRTNEKQFDFKNHHVQLFVGKPFSDSPESRQATCKVLGSNQITFIEH
jgi:hypothetical protein